MRYWLDDHAGLLFILVCLAILAGLGGLVIREDREERHQTQVACARMWSAARTSADTVAVIRDCELPKHSETTVVPMPIFISH